MPKTSIFRDSLTLTATWICPWCRLDYYPQDHDFDRCRWEWVYQMNVVEFALYRAAYQVASESQQQILNQLGQQADAGNQAAAKLLRQLVLDLCSTDAGSDKIAAILPKYSQ